MTPPKLVKAIEGGLIIVALLPLAACVGEVDSSEGSDQFGSPIAGGEAPCELDAVRGCEQTHEPGLPGYQLCIDSDAGPVWSDCMPDHRPRGPEDCSEGSSWTGTCCMMPIGCCESAASCNTPLVLSFDGREPSYHAVAGGGFDLTGRGLSMTSDWPTAATPWLAIDRSHDGAIDDGGELLGSATELAGGALASNGFEALAELDADGDGFITPADPRFGELLVWTDTDANRASRASELVPAADRGLLAIELRYRATPRCAPSGSCSVERARFWYRDGQGATHEGTVVDVHLASR